MTSSTITVFVRIYISFLHFDQHVKPRSRPLGHRTPGTEITRFEHWSCVVEVITTLKPVSLSRVTAAAAADDDDDAHPVHWFLGLVVNKLVFLQSAGDGASQLRTKVMHRPQSRLQVCTVSK